MRPLPVLIDDRGFVHVELVQDEVATCRVLGEARAQRAREARRRPTGMSGADLDVRGVTCEVAVAKWLGVYSLPAVDPDAHSKDVLHLQVRGTVKRPSFLHVRPGRDDPLDPYVLVYHRAADHLVVLGWEMASTVFDRGIDSDAWGIRTRCLPASALMPPVTVGEVLGRS